MKKKYLIAVHRADGNFSYGLRAGICLVKHDLRDPRIDKPSAKRNFITVDKGILKKSAEISRIKIKSPINLITEWASQQ